MRPALRIDILPIALMPLFVGKYTHNGKEIPKR
jgi:hypothetical protein